jgi:4-amino-4-deoxy-L-arabinose transferase-like glycosyltransferase
VRGKEAGLPRVAVQWHTLAGWLRSVIERNPWFAAALAGGAGLRLLAMIGYPGALWFAGDSYVYVGAALRPQPNLSKSTGYSLFLRLLLPFRSFTLVTLVQHLMMLAVAVMIYAMLRRTGVSKKWSTIAALPVLFDGYIIEDEHLIMAEALFTFCLFVAMFLLLWRKQTTWWVALIAGLLVGYAVIVRTEGLPVLVLFPAFLLIRSWRTIGWRRLQGWLVAAVMAVGCLAPVGAYMTWFHSFSGNWGLTRSQGFYLWGRVSSFADCSKIKAPADEMKLCPTVPVSKRTAPGDFVWHAPQVHDDLKGGPVSPANNRLLTSFAIHAVESQPLDYIKAVAKGVAMSVEWPRKNYPGSGTVYYYNLHMRYTAPPNDPNKAHHSVWIQPDTAYQDWLSYGHQAPGVVIKPVAILIAGYQRIFYTWGPLFGVIMIMGLGGVVRVRRRPFRLRWAPRAGSMLPWVTGAVLLLTPVALADFDYRYLIPVIPFASLAAGLGFAPAKPKPAPSGADPGEAAHPEPAQVA